MFQFVWLLLAALLLATTACSDDKDNKGPWGLPEGDTASIDDIRAVAQSGSGPAQVVPRTTNLPRGFHGDVHPLLEGQAEFSLRAEISPIRPGRALDYGYFPPHYYDAYRALRPAEVNRNYSAAKLSRLLPEQFDEVGQTWSVDLPTIASLLRQFHPGAGTSLRAPGRRAGPNGAFGLLRAASATHYEVLVRAHGELQLAEGIFLTPSCFLGRMLINRDTKSVEWLKIAVPQDQALNATLTVGLESEALIDIVHIDAMQLEGGDAAIADQLTWDQSLNLTEAATQLKSLFFEFMDIHWTNPEQAMELAAQSGKPILAVVLWGCLDEQNC
jgi:hypothetical protein